jgi:hypothetical protein
VGYVKPSIDEMDKLNSITVLSITVLSEEGQPGEIDMGWLLTCVRPIIVRQVLTKAI